MLAFFSYYDPSPERAELARRAADRALELEPGLPEGHWALGQYFDGCLDDYERAMDHYRVAARLRPNDPDILFGMGLSRSRQEGGWLESVSLFERAVAIDPQNPRNLIMLAGALSGSRRHEEAAAIIERAIAVAPDYPPAYQTRHVVYWSWYGPSPQSRAVLEDTPSSIAGMEFSWFMQEFHERDFEAALELVARHPEPWIGTWPKPLAECFCWYALQRPERVRPSCEAARAGLEQTLIELPEAHGHMITLGLTHAVLGNREQAVDYGERAAAAFPNPYASGARETALGLAMIYLLAGDHDAAIDHIEFLLAIPGQLSVAVLQNEVGWEPLYEHPRFQKLLETYATP
jgi:serine/threonine-protein kinase